MLLSILKLNWHSFRTEISIKNCEFMQPILSNNCGWWLCILYHLSCFNLVKWLYNNLKKKKKSCVLYNFNNIVSDSQKYSRYTVRISRLVLLSTVYHQKIQWRHAVPVGCYQSYNNLFSEVHFIHIHMIASDSCCRFAVGPPCSSPVPSHSKGALLD